MKDTQEIKNRIVIAIHWKDAPQEEKVLFNFSKVDIYERSEGKKYIRVLCGKTYYYFFLSISTIEEVVIY